MKQLNLYYIGGGEQKPDGRTVEPTDDIQIWLKCAGLNKPYTTLAEVLADSSTLEALIADSNAVDYLVRSTTFAKSEALVPTMTSDTTPSGECITAHERSGNEAYKAFDNDTTTTWSGYSGEANQYVGYIFPSQKKIKKCVIKFIQNPSSSSYTVPQTNWKIQIGDSWTDVGTFTIPSSSVTNTTTITKILDVETNKIRIFSSDTLYVAAQYNTRIQDIQFFNVEEGLTENATAMSYIGLNNYASNTLLADSTWCSAICNSTYFESVLNVKVPTMTSNTTPSGVALSNSEDTPAFEAFDGDNSTFWQANTNVSGSAAYIGYKFANSTKIYMANILSDVQFLSRFGNAVFQGSNDDFSSDINDLINAQALTANGIINFTKNINTYKSYRLYTAVATSAPFLYTLQFYGRADI